MSIVNGTINSLDDALIMRANNRKYISRGAQLVLNKTFYRNNISHDISISSRLHYDEMDRFQWEDKYKIENKIMRLTSRELKAQIATEFSTPMRSQTISTTRLKDKNTH